MDHAKSKRRPGMPKWARSIFDANIEDIERLTSTLSTYTHGLSMVVKQPELLKILGRALNDGEDAQHKTRLEHATDLARRARREVDQDYPHLNSWALVALWALLEATVRHYIAEHIRRRRTSWQLPELKRLRVRLGEYESIRSNERYLYVADLLEKEVAAGVRNGVDRFETLLSPFGLSGAVPERTAKAIYEMGQVRNVIIHRAGIVDPQFRKACPWVKGRTGTRLNVSSKMMARYLLAENLYITTLICRVHTRHGRDMSEHIETVWKADKRIAF